MLPHGSGINYNWYVWHKRDKFYASNMYDAMKSETGFYCHVYNFTATYKYNGQNAFTPCHICDGKGIRYIDDFHKYHELMTRDALINWLFSERDIDVHDNSWFYCASLIGAILANLLLAMGLAFLLGGLRYHDQEYNVRATRVYSTMMLLAVISLIIPSTFSRFFPVDTPILEEFYLNIGLAVVLLLIYLLYLVLC